MLASKFSTLPLPRKWYTLFPNHFIFLAKKNNNKEALSILFRQEPQVSIDSYCMNTKRRNEDALWCRGDSKVMLALLIHGSLGASSCFRSIGSSLWNSLFLFPFSFANARAEFLWWIAIVSIFNHLKFPSNMVVISIFFFSGILRDPKKIRFIIF